MLMIRLPEHQQIRGNCLPFKKRKKIMNGTQIFVFRLHFCFLFSLVDLLLLVDTELPGTAIDEQQETTNNGEDLEEVVLGEVLVRVVLVELDSCQSSRLI